MSPVELLYAELARVRRGYMPACGWLFSYRFFCDLTASVSMLRPMPSPDIRPRPDALVLGLPFKVIGRGPYQPWLMGDDWNLIEVPGSLVPRANYSRRGLATA